MVIHEAANIFPMDEENLDALAADIQANGLQVPVELLDGKVIDGRRRLRACEKAGVKPKFRDVTVADPVAYVLSLNLHRRHLTPSQMSMVGARARDLYDRAAKERQKASGGDRKSGKAKSVQENLPEPISGQARDAVGKAVGVSGRMIDFATKVLTQGEPELVKAVDEGRMAVSTAAVYATDEPEKQREVAAFHENGTPRTRKYEAVRNRVRGHETPERDPDNNPEDRMVRGKGIELANEAINCLIRIPKNDALRSRGLQLVTDWIKRNR